MNTERDQYSVAISDKDRTQVAHPKDRRSKILSKMLAMLATNLQRFALQPSLPAPITGQSRDGRYQRDVTGWTTEILDQIAKMESWRGESCRRSPVRAMADCGKMVSLRDWPQRCVQSWMDERCWRYSVHRRALQRSERRSIQLVVRSSGWKDRHKDESEDAGHHHKDLPDAHRLKDVGQSRREDEQRGQQRRKRHWQYKDHTE